MRASEIRNLLIQKYGVNPDVVARILDKKELKELLLSEMVKIQVSERFVAIKHFLFYFLYIVAGFLLLALAFRPIVGYFSNFRANNRKEFTKLKLVLKNFRKRRYFAGTIMFLSVFLDIVSSAMTISTFMSWILPRDSYFRRFMIPMLSFAVDTKMVSNFASGNVKGAYQDAAGGGGGGYGIDIGPMFTIAVVNWLITQLEELSASYMINDVKLKEEKRAYKRFNKQSNSLSKKQYDEDDGVSISESFVAAMRKSRSKGLTDDKDTVAENNNEFDIDESNRRMFGSDPPPLESPGCPYNNNDWESEYQPNEVNEGEELSSLPTNFEEIRQLNQHFANQHKHSVNNETVEYTTEDQVDICVLERLASFCEEAPNEDTLKPSPSMVNISDNATVKDMHANIPGSVSMADLHSTLMDNVTNVDYYCSDSEEVQQNVEVAEGLVSEDSDDETYIEAVIASVDSYDHNNIDK